MVRSLLSPDSNPADWMAESAGWVKAQGIDLRS
jgi:hypothetical protein